MLRLWRGLPADRRRVFDMNGDLGARAAMRKEKRRFPHPFASAKPRAMGKQYWLMKSEPDAYSWDDLVRDGSGIWDGVRNHTARQNMQAMKVGDERSEEHTSELQSLMRISYAVFCLKKKKKKD